MSNPSWTDENAALAKKLYLEGVSATVIGRKVHASRNAVIGKLARMGVTRSKTEQRRIQVNSGKRMHPIAHPAPPITYPRRELPHDGPVVSILALGRGVCRWPVGDPSDEAFGYCGARTAKVADDKPPIYCPRHARVAYAPPPPKKRAAA